MKSLNDTEPVVENLQDVRHPKKFCNVLIEFTVALPSPAVVGSANVGESASGRRRQIRVHLWPTELPVN